MAAAQAVASSSGVAHPKAVLLPSPSDTWKTDAKTTAFALAMLALFFTGAALLGYGLSSLPAIRITGFGFMYQLAAYHFMMLGCALLIGSAMMAASSAMPCRQDPNPTLP